MEKIKLMTPNGGREKVRKRRNGQWSVRLDRKRESTIGQVYFESMN